MVDVYSIYLDLFPDQKVPLLDHQANTEMIYQKFDVWGVWHGSLATKRVLCYKH